MRAMMDSAAFARGIAAFFIRLGWNDGATRLVSDETVPYGWWLTRHGVGWGNDTVISASADTWALQSGTSQAYAYLPDGLDAWDGFWLAGDEDAEDDLWDLDAWNLVLL